MSANNLEKFVTENAGSKCLHVNANTRRNSIAAPLSFDDVTNASFARDKNLGRYSSRGVCIRGSEFSEEFSVLNTHYSKIRLP